MWMGTFSWMQLLGLFIQSVFINNILLSFFLGMCTYLACSSRLRTANGLGIAVIFVLTCSGLLNWVIDFFFLREGALQWLSRLGIEASQVDLSFLRFILFISVIAAFVQIVEIVIEKLSSRLYHALGVYLPLITVNCAILGGCLLASTREYAFVPNLVYVFGLGVGWWLAIALIASIRERLAISNIPRGLQGMGITFITSGWIAMAFMGLMGIELGKRGEELPKELSVLLVRGELPSKDAVDPDGVENHDR